VAGLCEARRSNTTDRFPVKTKRVARRHESWGLLVLRKTEAGQLSIWLERRPPRGIWAGLHCVPVAGDDAQALAVAGEHAGAARHLPALAHALTHRELRLHPVLVDLVPGAAEPVIPNGRWVPMEQLSDVGLPAPVRSLLLQLPG
jgi:A/G-specific adenine glycosylase